MSETTNHTVNQIIKDIDTFEREVTYVYGDTIGADEYRRFAVQLVQLRSELKNKLVNNDFVQIAYEFRANKYLDYYYEEWIDEVLEILDIASATVSSYEKDISQINSVEEFKKVLKVARKLEKAEEIDSELRSTT